MPLGGLANNLPQTDPFQQAFDTQHFRQAGPDQIQASEFGAVIQHGHLHLGSEGGQAGADGGQFLRGYQGGIIR